jgi:microcystin-dependent protein
VTRLIHNFKGGQISDSPLTAGSTTAHSTAFADLPAVASPDTIAIVLDPEGDDGTPEIALITAHTASSDTVTVTRGQETSFGGSVAREHLVDTQWVLGITAYDTKRFNGHAGDLKTSIRTSDHDEWLLMGQTVLLADAKYPDLWSVAPAGWKSGTTLTLPTMTDKALIGGGTIGASGGANTHTLLEANLPAHTHGIDHDHGSVTSASGGVAHTHDITHNHSGEFTSHADPGAGGFFFGRRIVDTGTTINTSTVTDPTLVSGAASATAHTHAVDLPAFTGTGGSTGSGTAVDHTPSHLRVNVFIHI